jgi:hypothetical protein
VKKSPAMVPGKDFSDGEANQTRRSEARIILARRFGQVSAAASEIHQAPEPAEIESADHRRRTEPSEAMHALLEFAHASASVRKKCEKMGPSQPNVCFQR